MKRILLGVFAVVFLLGAGRATSTPDMYLVIIELKAKTQIAELANLGFDIAGVDLEHNEFSVVTDSVGVKQLKNIKTIKTISSSFVVETLDSSFKQNSDVEKILKDIEKSFPNLAVVSSIGKSTDGRDIWAIRITDRFVIPTNDKPVILVDSMHHAREVMTPEVALDMAQYLTSNYGKDKKVDEWLRMNEIWIVPMLNPDGNNTVWNSSSMWRKNTRGGYGVDNNRNYPYAWNACSGSSGSTGAQDYRGPSAGSEPETKAIMALAESIHPAINVSLHSFSEIVIYPYGCPSDVVPPAQKTIIVNTATALAKKLTRDSGSGSYTPGTSYDLLYPVDGGSIDWMFSKLGALAFVIEMNSETNGFQPSYSKWRDSTVSRLRPGWQYMLDRLNGSSIRVETTSRVRVETDAGEKVFEKDPDSKGWAHFIVEPGRYRVVDTTGRWSSSSVTVGSSPVAVHLTH